MNTSGGSDQAAICERFGLYLVLTDPVAGYESCAEAAVAAGVRYLQLRMKTASSDARLETARLLRAITAGSVTRFIVNDDPDLAVAVGADGVHLGQDDESLSMVRARCPSLRIFGLSTHSLAQVAAAVSELPDYIGVGPVFPTPSKARPDPTLGVVGMERMVATAVAAGITPVAIGGINAENLHRVLAHGAVNYAVIRAVGAASDPLAAIRHLQTLA